MNELPSPESLLGKRPDGQWDTALMERLKLESEAVQLHFLASVMVSHEKARRPIRLWFDMAASLLKEKSSLEQLLRVGLQCADASSIQQWMSICIRRMGIRGVISVLEESESANPSGVEGAEYWLMKHASTSDERNLAADFLDQPHRVARRRRRRGGQT